jgi:hypothetical protein
MPFVGCAHLAQLKHQLNYPVIGRGLFDRWIILRMKKAQKNEIL